MVASIVSCWLLLNIILVALGWFAGSLSKGVKSQPMDFAGPTDDWSEPEGEIRSNT